jgi:hypothetical protein
MRAVDGTSLRRSREVLRRRDPHRNIDTSQSPRPERRRLDPLGGDEYQRALRTAPVLWAFQYCRAQGIQVGSLLPGISPCFGSRRNMLAPTDLSAGDRALFVLIAWTIAGSGTLILAFVFLNPAMTAFGSASIMGKIVPCRANSSPLFATWYGLESGLTP